jgi:hypothetical protein
MVIVPGRVWTGQWGGIGFGVGWEGGGRGQGLGRHINGKAGHQGAYQLCPILVGDETTIV